MSKYVLLLLLLVGCQAEPETPEPVDTQSLQVSGGDFRNTVPNTAFGHYGYMELPEGFPSNEEESRALIDMVRTSTPNNRWWGAGDTWWSMHEQRLYRRPIATEESRRWLRAWLNRGQADE